VSPDSIERPTTSSISVAIDPIPLRFLTSQGVDRATARQIVEQATFEWQHGNTVVTPMRVAIDYVARARCGDVAS
jgi:hypothetical protein